MHSYSLEFSLLCLTAAVVQAQGVNLSATVTATILSADGFVGALIGGNALYGDNACGFGYTLTCTDTALCGASSHLEALQDAYMYQATYTASSVNTASLSPYATYRESSSSGTVAARQCSLYGRTSMSCKYFVHASGRIEVFQHEVSAPAGETLKYAQVPITANVAVLPKADLSTLMPALASCIGGKAIEMTKVTGAQGSSTGTATGTNSSPERPGTSSGDRTSSVKPGQSGISSGAKIGIGVGVGLGLVALCALSFFLWRRNHPRKDATPPGDPRLEITDPSGEVKGVISPYEMEHSERTKELPTGKEAHELAAQSSSLAELDVPSRDSTTWHELPSTRL